MFSSLGKNIQNIFGKLKNKGVLTEQDINNAVREIRIALLEADVALVVVKNFINKVKDKALGQEVMKSISPGQMVVKIVHDELVAILQDDKSNFLEMKKSPTVMMVVGLQGSGKTTTCAKLANRIRSKYKKNVMLASADIYRPAAQLQLEKLSKQINVDFLSVVKEEKPLAIAKRAMAQCQKNNIDVLIFDTAGRLQNDQELMKELKELNDFLSPGEILLVTDAMIGQESVSVASEFAACLPISGIVLTRIDGDTRGGVALSMKETIGCPIKYMGVGEKINEIEEFHGERVASRILGMGDVLSLVERASEHIDSKDIDQMMNKLEKGKFDMNDLLSQMRKIKKMGNISSLIAMVPGMSSIKEKLNNSANENALTRTEAIICSMTKKEKSDPSIINGPRKKRISLGSGTKIQDVNLLLKQYHEAKKMLKKVGKLDKKQAIRMMQGYK